MLCGVALASTGANAELQWDYSGFASLGAGKLSNDSLTFMDYDGEWSLDSDSMLAMQLIVQSDERWSVTGQVLSKGFSFDGHDPYEPRLQWLFVGYELSPELRVRVGRLRTPHFLYSESLEIGYSYPWVRPPVDMYANFLEPFANFDGMDLTWQKDVLGLESEFLVFAGSTETGYRGRDIDVGKMAGMAALTRWDAFTFRYCYNWNQLSIFDPKLQVPIQYYQLASELTGQQIFNDIANSLQMDAGIFQYHGLGVQWDAEPWTVIAEKLKNIGPGKQFSFDNDGWYLTVGRQMDAWMPYVSVGEYRSQIDPAINKRVRDSYAILPAGISGDLDYLREQTILGMDDLSVYHRSYTAGVRYDFHPNAALKVETEYFHFRSTGQMLFDDSQPEPSSVVATTLVIDVVF